MMTKKEKLQMEKLKDFASYYATCPCCDQNEVCLEDCTFKDDACNDSSAMEMAREALK